MKSEKHRKLFCVCVSVPYEPIANKNVCERVKIEFVYKKVQEVYSSFEVSNDQTECLPCNGVVKGTIKARLGAVPSRMASLCSSPGKWTINQ